MLKKDDKTNYDNFLKDIRMNEPTSDEEQCWFMMMILRS